MMDFHITKARALGPMAVLLFGLALTNHTASAATTNGSSALALASLVGAHSPVLSLYDKRVLALLFRGHVHVVFPVNEQISVEADGIACSAGHVDITRHFCILTFGAKTSTLTGRNAHELHATMLEVGVSPDGSAGVAHESLLHLICTINPHEIAQKGGGGADCTFDTAAPPSAESNQ